jgi:aryl-alcohol dehydrogenase-like predicted oxidoreductase
VERRRLGGSGMDVPAMGIGTDSWGEKLLGYGKRYGPEDLYQAYRACLDAGLNFFDTAEGYARGQSESLIGQFRRRDGRDIVVATKFDNPIVFPRSGARARPGSVVAALDASLKRLGLERVDLYQVHFPLPSQAVDGFMDALAAQVKAGKIGAVGVSNFSADLMRQASASLGRHGIPLASNQVCYSLLHRHPEGNGVLAACRELDVALIAYTPLATGVLTGKYRLGGPKPTLTQRLFLRFVQVDPFHEWPNRPPLIRRLVSTPRALRFQKLEPLFRCLEEIGSAHGRTTVQVALGWLLTADPLVIPIPGAKNLRQARENAGALNWRLSAEERARISAAEAASR